MAFSLAPILATPRRAAAGTCSSRRATPPYAASRKPKPGAPPRRRRRAGGGDPIMDDDDVDMTAISTFKTCPTCANSLMVSPDAFLPSGTVALKCNVCERKVTASIADLETISGDKFDATTFMARATAGVGGEGGGDAADE